MNRDVGKDGEGGLRKWRPTPWCPTPHVVSESPRTVLEDRRRLVGHVPGPEHRSETLICLSIWAYTIHDSCPVPDRRKKR